MYLINSNYSIVVIAVVAIAAVKLNEKCIQYMNS